MPKKQNPLPDIYHAQAPDLERDYTPQVATSLVAERERALRLQRWIMGAIGLLMTASVIGLILFTLRDYTRRMTAAPPPEVRGEEALLPLVIMPSRGVDPDDGAPGGMPASRLKEAAYQIVMGQRRMGGEPQRALDHFISAIELFPRMEGIQLAAGQLAMRSGRHADAVAHLKIAVEEDETFSTWMLLAEAALIEEMYEQAEAALLRARALRPEDPAGYLLLARLYRQTGRGERALEQYERYLELRPGDIGTLQIYARLLSRAGRWDEAVAAYRVMAGEADVTAPVLFLYAQVLAQAGHHDEALATLADATARVDPSLALNWMRRNEFDPLRQNAAFRELERRLVQRVNR